MLVNVYRGEDVSSRFGERGGRCVEIERNEWDVLIDLLVGFWLFELFVAINLSSKVISH